MKNWAKWLIVVLFFLFLTKPFIVQAAEINLRGDSREYEVGREFLVSIEVVAFKKTLGTDIKLKFDNSKLKLVEVIPGTTYPNFSNLEDLTEIKGELYLSGTSDLSNGVIPNGKMVDLKFIPNKSGEATIEIVYDPTDTTSTAVIPFVGDELNLLTQAPDTLTINIKAPNWWQRTLNWFKNSWTSWFTKLNFFN